MLESGSVGFWSGWVGLGRVWSGLVGYLSGLVGYQSGLIAKHAIAKLQKSSGARHFSEDQWVARRRVWALVVSPEVVECCRRSVWTIEEKAEVMHRAFKRNQFTFVFGGFRVMFLGGRQKTL